MEDIQAYIILFMVSCLLFTVLTKTWARNHLPPSPLSLPIIGHLHLLGPLPHQSLHKLSKYYGPLIHLSLGSVACFVASSPEMAKEFLKTHESSFLNRPRPSVMDIISYPSATFSFSDYGPYWKFMKKLSVSRLLGGQTLSKFVHVRREERKSFLDSISQKARENREVHIGGELGKLSNNIISRLVMGKRCSENERTAEELRNAVNESSELFGMFNLSDYIWFLKRLDLQGIWKKGKQIHEKFDKMLEMAIEEHQEARKYKGKCDHDEAKDLIDILLEISEDNTSEIKLTREEIKGFVLDTFIGGTDTSTVTVEWAMAELINHPEIMNKAREEIESTIGKKRLVEESDIANLPYIQAIVKETFRLHPTAPIIPRKSTKSCTINGYYIPEETHLLVNVWAIGRDPNHWEDPLEFKPERFLINEESPKSQLDVRGQYFQLLPFGSGRRICPGISLALLLVETSIAAMIQCFEWRVDGKDRMVDMEEGPGLLVPRLHPLKCVPVSRYSQLPL